MVVEVVGIVAVEVVVIVIVVGIVAIEALVLPVVVILLGVIVAARSNTRS